VHSCSVAESYANEEMPDGHPLTGPAMGRIFFLDGDGDLIGYTFTGDLITGYPTSPAGCTSDLPQPQHTGCASYATQLCADVDRAVVVPRLVADGRADGLASVEAVVPPGAEYVGVVWELPVAVGAPGDVPSIIADDILASPGLSTTTFSRRTWADPRAAPAVHPDGSGLFPVDPTVPFGGQAFVPKSCDDLAWRWIPSGEADERAAAAAAAFAANPNAASQTALTYAQDPADCWSTFLP
jgi:hypothetical protein